MCDSFFHFILSFVRLSFVRFSLLQLNVKPVVSPVFARIMVTQQFFDRKRIFCKFCKHVSSVFRYCSVKATQHKLLFCVFCIALQQTPIIPAQKLRKIVKSE